MTYLDRYETVEIARRLATLPAPHGIRGTMAEYAARCANVAACYGAEHGLPVLLHFGALGYLAGTPVRLRGEAEAQIRFEIHSAHGVEAANGDILARVERYCKAKPCTDSTSGSPVVQFYDAYAKFAVEGYRGGCNGGTD